MEQSYCENAIKSRGASGRGLGWSGEGVGC